MVGLGLLQESNSTERNKIIRDCTHVNKVVNSIQKTTSTTDALAEEEVEGKSCT